MQNHAWLKLNAILLRSPSHCILCAFHVLSQFEYAWQQYKVKPSAAGQADMSNRSLLAKIEQKLTGADRLINTQRFMRANLRLTACTYDTARANPPVLSEFNSDNAEECTTSPMRRPAIINVQGLTLTPLGYQTGAGGSQHVRRRLFDDAGTPCTAQAPAADIGTRTVNKAEGQTHETSTPTHNQQHQVIDFTRIIPAFSTAHPHHSSMSI
jgi:hypothetical protein